MAVFAGPRLPIAHHEPGLRLPHDGLEGVRRQMVALVNDDVAVVGDPIVDDALLDEALNQGDIDQSRRSRAAAAHTTDRLLGKAEDGRELRNPLIEELTAVHKDQCVHLAPGDQPRSHDRLAECRRCGEHAGIMRDHPLGSGHLLGPQLATKYHVKKATSLAFVTDVGAYAELREFLASVVQASARHPDVLGMVFGASDDAGLS
jgi:hypothetical protein